MHLYFNCFSDETINVAGFCGKEFGLLQSDSVVFIKAVFSLFCVLAFISHSPSCLVQVATFQTQ